MTAPETALWAWVALAGLGALHGLNPAMGWLFAVALGLQEGRARAVWRALPPLAMGHALAIAAAVGLAALAGGLIPLSPLRWAVAACLLAFGVYRLKRHGHPRYGGMRVGARQLTLWSFLMATAHGAGLMIIPIVLAGENPLVAAGMPGVPVEHMAAGHPHHHVEAMAGVSRGISAGLAVTLVHTVGYLVVSAGLAWLVFARLGVGVIRKAWINLDLVWAGALIITALLTPFI